MQLTRPLCFLDIESTGPDPQTDRIIELGISVIHPDKSERTRWSSRFNPTVPIPAEATVIHGITDEMVKDCPLFSERAEQVSRFIQGKDFGGYNLWRFDLPILDEELRRSGFCIRLGDVHVIDVFGIFQKKQPRKLEDAVRAYCGREHTDAHGAESDADASADVLFGQIAAHPDLAEMDLPALATFSMPMDQRPVDLAGKLYRDADGVLRFNFGKNKGKAVLAEKGYVFWMLNKAQFPGSTCELLEAEMQKGRAA